MNVDIWIVGTNQLYITGSYTKTKLPKNKVATGKTSFFVIGPFCNPHSICLHIDYERAVLYGYIRLLIVVL